MSGILLKSKTKAKKYSAAFGPEQSLLSRFERGFCLTGIRSINTDLTRRHAYVCGGSGSGKSSVCLTPTLQRLNGQSVIINDPGHDLFEGNSASLFAKQYEVFVWDQADIKNCTLGFNPLDNVKTDSDAGKIAHTLVKNRSGKGSKDPFWDIQSEKLITLMIQAVMRQEPKYRNLANVYRLVSSMSIPRELDDFFISAGDDLFLEYQSMVGYGEKLLGTITASAQAALSIFKDETIARITAHSSVSFEDLRKRRIAIFVQNRIGDASYYAPLTALYFEGLFNFIVNKVPAPHERRDIYILLDECASLYLPTLQKFASTARKSYGSLMVVVQDHNQLIDLYGKPQATAILSNMYSKVYFPGQGLECATELESILGQVESEDDKGRISVRPLMTRDEIRMMPNNRALILCGNHKPIYAKTVPFYKQFGYSKQSPLVLKNKPEFKPVEYLPLKQTETIHEED